MQGVAPFVQKHLKQEYGVQSVNLSKQSTGLSYPNFFDWPKTIEQTLPKEPDIAFWLYSWAQTTPLRISRWVKIPEIRLPRMGGRIPQPRPPYS